MYPQSTLLVGAFLCFGLGAAPLALSADRYDVAVLPYFAKPGGEALNNNGVVAGGIMNSDGSISLAEWRNGLVTNLGVPPGLPSRGFNKPHVFGMNNAGAIVGSIHSSAAELPSRCFIYKDGRFTVLPLVDPTDLGGAAIGINDGGEVVGYDRTSDNYVIGWLWSNGAYSSLPIPGTNTAALGINSSGTIIGNRFGETERGPITSCSHPIPMARSDRKNWIPVASAPGPDRPLLSVRDPP